MTEPDPPALPPPPEGEPVGGQLLPRPEPLRPWRTFTFLVPVAILVVVLSLIRLPYFVIEPGIAQDVEPLIHVKDHPSFPPHGHLLLTAVHLYQPNVYQLIGAWLDRTRSVLDESDILGPGESEQQEFQRALSQMDTSKIDAAVVALTRYADYPAQHGKGVLVESVLDGSPAAGKLAAGDLIQSIDGTPVADPDQLGKIIRSAGIGTPLTFHIMAAGETHDVTVAPAKVRGYDNPIVGIAPVANFPFPLTIDSGDIGGPSAGLMWTLGVVDVLTPGDLTGGKTIAGTGTIKLDGTVGPIGGIEQKVVAAERAGAVVFFAPVQEAPDARAVAHRIAVVPVASYLDAIAWLEQHGGST